MICLILLIIEAQARGTKKTPKQEEQIRMENELRWEENKMNQKFNKDIHIDPYSREKQMQEERDRKLMNNAEDEFEDADDF